MDKSLHNKYGLLNDHIGLLQVWGWKKQYLFLDFESGEIVYNINPKDVQLCDKSVVDERNYTKPKNGEVFDERQKIYGKIHDNTTKLWLDDRCIEQGGEYSQNYCLAVAHLFAMDAYRAEMIDLYGVEYGEELIQNLHKLPKEMNEANRRIMFKHVMGGIDGQPATYDIYCTKMGVGVDAVVGQYIPESEILILIQKIKTYGAWGKRLFETELIADCEEMQFMLKNF